MRKKIYLFRHGETDWNKENRIQCSIDIELNETGLKQAEENAELLKDKGIQHIYSSKQKRSYKTGEVLANKIGVAIEIIDGLQEILGGDFEGKTKSEIKNIMGEEWYKKFFHTRNEALDSGYPNGETKRQVRTRIVDTVNKICEMTPYDIIGIASHGFVLTEMLRFYDFEDDSGLKNCEAIEAEYEDGTFKILDRLKSK